MFQATVLLHPAESAEYVLLVKPNLLSQPLHAGPQLPLYWSCLRFNQVEKGKAPQYRVEFLITVRQTHLLTFPENWLEFVWGGYWNYGWGFRTRFTIEGDDWIYCSRLDVWIIGKVIKCLRLLSSWSDNLHVQHPKTHKISLNLSITLFLAYQQTAHQWSTADPAN